jgi:hypothetical protein
MLQRHLAVDDVADGRQYFGDNVGLLAEPDDFPQFKGRNRRLGDKHHVDGVFQADLAQVAHGAKNRHPLEDLALPSRIVVDKPDYGLLNIGVVPDLFDDVLPDAAGADDHNGLGIGMTILCFEKHSLPEQPGKDAHSDQDRKAKNSVQN